MLFADMYAVRTDRIKNGQVIARQSSNSVFIWKIGQKSNFDELGLSSDMLFGFGT